jgi:regulator of replication initiation timing
MFQILILKLSDVDKHVEHLEKMVASLCEDNTLLANRIKALEDRLSRQAEIPLAEPIAEPISVAEAVLGYSLPK